MFYVHITAAGWEKFHGDFGGYQFQDARSVDPLPRAVCDRLSALVHVELFDADGESHGQGGAAARQATRRDLPSPVIAPLARQSADDKGEEAKKAFDEAGNSKKRPIYTKDQLEQIATLEGIAGLREVAKGWNVKDRSIPKLIQLIISAQNKFSKEQEQKLQEQRAARAAAGDAAMAEQLRLEAEAFANSRVLTTDETPNSVDAAGNPVFVEPKPKEAEPKTEGEAA